MVRTQRTPAIALCVSRISWKALASLVSCVEWGARVGLSGLRGNLGGGDESPGSVVSHAAERLVSLGSGVDRQGRPVVILRLGELTNELVEACGKKALIRRGLSLC